MNTARRGEPMTELEDRVSKLEVQCHEITKDMQETKTNVSVFNALLQRFSDVQEKLVNTMDEVRLTMKEMQGEIKYNTTQMIDMKQTMDRLEKNIETVEKDVKTVDDKSKVDILDVLKKIAIALLSGGGIVYMIVDLLSKPK
jgi:chromosome segregation ATPase